MRRALLEKQLKKNYQVGEVTGFKGKRAIVQVGQLPMQIELEDLMVVEKIESVTIDKENQHKKK